MSQLPIAAQMYTVRDAAAQDLLAALGRVAEIGYAGVELAGLFDQSATKVAQTLGELGLTCVSAHVPLADLRRDLDHQLETCRVLGAAFLVCPWLAPEARGDEAAYRALATELNEIGERCRGRGLQFCYHHHDFELVQFNGRYALDILLDESDPANLQLEPDTYWLNIAGLEPAAYIRRRSGRVPLIHLKDVSADDPPTFAEVGRGTLNWAPILAAARASGAAWYIVEQDTCQGDPFDSLWLSFENLQGMLT